jgi:hypothetical protein
MGRTIPSFRIASIMEKEEWKSFRKALDRKDRKIFDDMFDISILYNSASAYSAKYIRIHPIFMSIIFHHYKKLTEISERIKQIKNEDSQQTLWESLVPFLVLILYSKEEVDRFLGSKLNLQIVTIDEEGDPNIQPVWFWYVR